MRLSDLLERESDSFNTKIVNRAITALIKFLEPIWDAETVNEATIYHALGDRFIKSTKQNLLVIPLGEVPGIPPALGRTLLVFDVMSGWSTHGGFGIQRQSYEFNGTVYRDHVTLNILPRYKDFETEWIEAFHEAAKSFAYSENVRQLFRHEIAHALDYRKHQGRDRQREVGFPDRDKAAYFNSSTEINSYFTNLVAALQSAGEIAAKGNAKAFYRFGFNGDPRNDFKKSVAHATDLPQVSEWMRALTPESRKRVMKRFATVHREVLVKVRAAEEMAETPPPTE